MSSVEVWNTWDRRIRRVADRILSMEADVRGSAAEIFPPVPGAQVNELRNATGISLPDDFAEWLTKHCGGFDMWWVFDELDTPLGRCFSGGCSEAPFIDAYEGKTLLGLFNDLQEQLRHTYLYNEQYDDDEHVVGIRECLKHCFPLSFMFSMSGDMLALRCDVEPAHVVFLDHERKFRTDGEAIVGIGFSDFMNRWTQVGCVEFDTYSALINKETRLLDETLPIAQEWIKFLAIEDV